MKHAKLIIAGGAAVAVTAVAYFASPFVAANALADALHRGDAQKVEALVDFPAVKESLRPQVTAIVTKRPEITSMPFGERTMDMVPHVVDMSLNLLATPESLKVMASGRDPFPAAPPPGPEITHVPAPGAGHTRHSFSYDGLNRFRACAMPAANPVQKACFIFERRNVLAWKLVGVELPNPASPN